MTVMNIRSKVRFTNYDSTTKEVEVINTPYFETLEWEDGPIYEVTDTFLVETSSTPPTAFSSVEEGRDYFYNLRRDSIKSAVATATSLTLTHGVNITEAPENWVFDLDFFGSIAGVSSTASSALALANTKQPLNDLLTSLTSQPFTTESILMLSGVDYLSQTTIAAAGKTIMACEDMAAIKASIAMTAADVDGLEAALALKFNTPTGTTSQYVRGNGTLATFPTLATVATTGNYYDLSTKPADKSYSSRSSYTFVTTAAAANGDRLSTFRHTHVSYNVTISAAVQIGVVTNVGGYIALEIAPTNSTTAGDWVEISRVGTAQNIGIALALSSTQTVTGTLTGLVPAGYYRRLRTVNVNGTPTYTYLSGQEVLEEPLQVAA